MGEFQDASRQQCLRCETVTRTIISPVCWSALVKQSIYRGEPRQPSRRGNEPFPESFSTSETNSRPPQCGAVVRFQQRLSALDNSTAQQPAERKQRRAVLSVGNTPNLTDIFANAYGNAAANARLRGGHVRGSHAEEGRAGRCDATSRRNCSARLLSPACIASPRATAATGKDREPTARAPNRPAAGRAGAMSAITPVIVHRQRPLSCVRMGDPRFCVNSWDSSLNLTHERRAGFYGSCGSAALGWSALPAHTVFRAGRSGSTPFGLQARTLPRQVLRRDGDRLAGRLISIHKSGLLIQAIIVAPLYVELLAPKRFCWSTLPAVVDSGYPSVTNEMRLS